MNKRTNRPVTASPSSEIADEFGIPYLPTLPANSAFPAQSRQLRTFRITWRETERHPRRVEDWPAATPIGASFHWGKQWGLRACDCVEFSIIKIADRTPVETETETETETASQPDSRPMLTFRFVWRPEAGGDIYEQDWQGPSRSAARRRWTRFYGLRVRDCAEFSMTLVEV